MGLNDVDKLRTIFNEIDTNMSGYIDEKELFDGLVKAGKFPTESQVGKIMKDYGSVHSKDPNAKKELSFSQYQTLVANFDEVLADMGAPPAPTGRRGSRNSRDLIPLLPAAAAAT